MEMLGRRGSRNTLFAGSHVRGDDQHFGELNTCAGYTPPRNNRVVYPRCRPAPRWPRYTPPRNNRVVYPFVQAYRTYTGKHHPEITGLYTPPHCTYQYCTDIHRQEITGLYTVGLYVTIVEMDKIMCNHCTLYLVRHNTPAFRHGDISHTVFPRKRISEDCVRCRRLV